MRSSSPSAEIDRLKERVATLGALLDLAGHDIEKLYDLLAANDRLRRKVLALLEYGQVSRAVAALRWSLRQ